MSIRIDSDRCVGCGRCAEICPGSLIRMDAGKAYIKYPKDCWGCTSCIKECSVQAIRFYLGKDIGGRGSEVYTVDHGDILSWIIEKPDGTKTKIDIDRRESNKY